ncbi:cytoplasmic protein [candidate division GN15 bacterium]|uniref:Cytoplasmic protein n=1 Tax=candidate division GN15 bacterium TaxID=2072418 RepID=A0A855X3J5_9BACT|nr:MAG: cytoplasmic protein [candidate division GN15 bacterium]
MISRREFLKTTGQAVALAGITTGVGILFHNRSSAKYAPILLKTGDYRVPNDALLPRLTLCHNDDAVVALNKSLDAIGGIKRFVEKGERVVIKPNLGWDRTPETGANTSPILVGEMVRLCIAAGAAEVIVTDVSCNDPRRCYIRSGVREAVEKAGGKALLPREEDFVKTVIDGKMITTWPVLKYFVQTDKLINMPIIKQHSLLECTCSMKNWYGILGGPRHQLHQKIDQSIVDLAAFCRPTLTVVDATRVLLRNGPTGGSLDDVAIENTVLCATDEVAADSRACEFLGLRGDHVGHIVLAEKTGLGKVDYRAAGYKEVA